jgi:aminoglycoside phosphotransferase (APT) family kinase protein
MTPAGASAPGASAAWAPERRTDAARAARLVAAAAPGLAGRRVDLLGEGWDNTVFLVGGDWVFRFPRRALALPGFRRETAVLPRVAGRLPLAVPVPEVVADDGEAEPWPYTGARLVRGRELAESGLADDGRWAGDPAVTALLDEAARLDPPAGPPVLVHGDLHVRHVLVGDDGSATGVIDWGDVCLGDPAVDLALAHAALAGPARRAFLDAYGPVDGERELRARALAVRLSALLAGYAAADARPRLLTEALAGLRRAVA